jgi:hypothetical protein
MSAVKSRTGRIALAILLLFVATLIVMVPVGILGSSNIVWGEAGTLVPVVAVGIVLVGGGAWFVVSPRMRRRRRPTATVVSTGALTDAEFAAEKARVIGDTEAS